MPHGGPEIVAGNTTAYRNFLAFHHFWIALAFLWREKPERLVEAGQFERSDCGRASWLFDVAVDCFRRAERLMNDAVRSELISLLRGGQSRGKLPSNFRRRIGRCLAT